MRKKLLLVGGIINTLFVIFHFYLGYALFTVEGVSADIRALLIMLNVGVTLFILLFALAFLFYARDVLTSGLGRLTLLFATLIYGTRAIEEVILAPQMSIVILLTCSVPALLYGYLWFGTGRDRAVKAGIPTVTSSRSGAAAPSR